MSIFHQRPHLPTSTTGLKILGVDETSTLPYLLELLAVKDSGIDKIPMSPEAKKDRIMEAFKQIALKGSEIRPLILAYEDLHWIDKSSEELLKYVLESIPGARVLLIFTYRPEFVHTWGAKSYHSQVMLNRLSNRESLMMVSHLLGTEELDKDLEEFILEKTEGVPFFIEELIKSPKDLKIIDRENNRYRITKDIKEVTIPATVQDVIMARVDSLPPEMKGLLQTISAVGRESSYDLIKQVTGLTEQELLPQLSVLKDSELLYERGIYPQSTYIFKHALTQDVAYNSLLQKKKKEIHAGIGSAMEDQYPDRLEEHYELLAYHYGRSANADKAVQYLDLANQKAAKLNALEEAKAYFDEAMALLDALPETEENRQRRISLLVNQGIVFFLLFNLRWHTYALSVASRAYACLGRWDEAVEGAQKALSVAEEFSDNSLISFVAWNLSIAYTWKGDLARAIEYGELAVQRAPTHADKAWAQRSLGWAWCRGGDTTRGIELLTTVLAIFRAGRFITGDIPLTCYLGEGHWRAGESEKARQMLEEGLEMAERYGVRYYTGFAQRLLGESVLKTNPAQAVPHFEKSIAIFREIKAENELAMAYAGYGRLHNKQAETVRAREYLMKALEILSAWAP